MYKHLLIATDGSELAGKGVEHGLYLAKQLGAEVTLLSVTEPLSSEVVRAARSGGVSDPVTLYEQNMDEQVNKFTDSAKARAGELGVTIDVARETDSSPAEAIVRTAKLRNCDLIVMASHGRRGIQKMLLGSQTSEVLVRTTIPVLVIR
ncbi:universal stress protein [Devosia sp.]|uniref:universal stress protein n=1 Tax=Devosia sp. TaxID=1871048 RepID=UPI002F22DD7F